MNTTIQREFYRNGQLRREAPLRNSREHGVVRAWHNNGAPASEEPFHEGLAHGVCRQWDEADQLLGQYVMKHGTGIQRAWHDNGQLQMEVSTVRGEFCGRNRIWLRDGTLLSERWYLHGRIVNASNYERAAAGDLLLPKVRGERGTPLVRSRQQDQHIHRVFVSGLLEKRGRREAWEWLKKGADDKTLRSLGRFKDERGAVTFVQALYDAGAIEVIVPDACSGKGGDQFADALLVELPGDRKRRKAVRAVCAKLRRSRLGSVEPEADIDETHLFLSLN